jgi:hypothetical protein|nr:MAG TPA: protein of unknown function (DUF4969) [Caudoviricetes sp.]
MKKIFIGIAVITFIGLVISTRPQNKPVNKVEVKNNLIVPDIPQDSSEEEKEVTQPQPEIKYVHKYYFKGKEITKEQYEVYQKQVQQAKQQIEMLKVLRVVAEEYDRSHPSITYRRYSDGRVETRIDE